MARDADDFVIKTRGLTKAYPGGVTALTNLDLEVRRNSIFGFLGPNGAGKTTTLRILTCYMPATSGAASVAGHDVFTESLAVRQAIGYLPENVPMYTDMRVREYLNFRGKLRGLEKSARDAGIKRVAEQCWLGDFIERPIQQLSKGMRQRVGLADALLHDPKVLILDEPTVGLDPAQIRETRTLIKDLARRHTVILSSHILPEVEATCQRTIIIAGGKIVASGTPEQLKDRIRGGSRLIAEIHGPTSDVAGGVEKVNGVKHVAHTSNNGWVRLTIDTDKNADPREDIVKMSVQKGWRLREIRLEVGSLEEFFVQITAQQQMRDADRRRGTARPQEGAQA